MESMAPAAESPVKKPWHSKTIIANLVLAGLAFVPGGSEWYAAHPDIVAAGFAIVNVVLRFVTKKQIQIS
jgi:hypothetical protein